jgi:hypothetical protein
VAACAAVAGEELGWDAERIQHEVRAVDAFYQVDPASPLEP